MHLPNPIEYYFSSKAERNEAYRLAESIRDKLIPQHYDRKAHGAVIPLNSVISDIFKAFLIMYFSKYHDLTFKHDSGQTVAVFVPKFSPECMTHLENHMQRRQI